MENKEKKVFAEGLCFKKVFWIFIFGCVFGCVMETVLSFINHGTWVSRKGLIYGPLIPVYGVGATLFTVFLCKGKNIIWIFIGGALLGGGFEYICSLLQENIFGTISWDYSDKFLNFHGRTSLYYMVCWGFLAILFVKVIYPLLSKWIEKIPIKVGNIITIIMVGFLIFDIVISVFACYRQSQRDQGNKADTPVEAFLDTHYPDDRLNEIFENARKAT